MESGKAGRQKGKHEGSEAGRQERREGRKAGGKAREGAGRQEGLIIRTMTFVFLILHFGQNPFLLKSHCFLLYSLLFLQEISCYYSNIFPPWYHFLLIYSRRFCTQQPHIDFPSCSQHQDLWQHLGMNKSLNYANIQLNTIVLKVSEVLSVLYVSQICQSL